MVLPVLGLLHGAPRPPGMAAERRVTPTVLPEASWLAWPQPAPAPVGSTVTLVLLPSHLRPSMVPVLVAIRHPAKHLCSEQEPWHRDPKGTAHFSTSPFVSDVGFLTNI